MATTFLRGWLRTGTLLILLGTGMSAAAQSLDPSFHIPEIYTEAYITDAAQQANGQYVVAGGITRANGQPANSLLRLDATSAVDQLFRQNLNGASVVARQLVPMPNGQLLVRGDYQAGATRREYLFRLNADGTLDAAFTLGLPNVDEVRQVLVQPDGRILIYRELGSTGLHPVGISRLFSNGAPDPSFNTTLYVSGSVQMLLQADGKVLIGATDTNGVSINGSNVGSTVGRVNSDGTTDTSYQPLTPARVRFSVLGLALDATGALLVSGGNGATTSPVSGIFRLLSTGAFDPSFTLDASLNARTCNRVVVQPSGQIVAMFDTYSSGPAPLPNPLYRLQPNGTIDPTFQVGSGPDGFLNELRGQASGQLLTWGNSNNFAGQRRTLTLLQPGGALEAGFAPLLQQPGRVDKIVRQADGKLVLAGGFNSIDSHLTDRVARLMPDGHPDVAFARRQTGLIYWQLSALAVQANGQVLVAGNNDDLNPTRQPIFQRLATNGTPDAGFVPALLFNLSNYGTIALVAEQANGQLIVGGNFVDAAGKANLTRLTATGTVDPAFTPPANQPMVYQGFVQANGAIVCVVPVVSVPYSQTIRRLLPNGTLDLSFTYTPPPPSTTAGLPNSGLEYVAPVPSTGGYVASGTLDSTQVLACVTATGANVAAFASSFRPIQGPALPYSGVNAMAAQPDGRIIVGGYMQQSSQFGAVAIPLARLEANGQPDATFNTNIITNSTGSRVYDRYSVADVLVQPNGAIVVGGDFMEAGGQPVTGLIRLLPTGTLGVGAVQTPAKFQAWPVPAHDVLHLSLSAVARPQRVTLLDALGKTALTLPVTQPELTLNTAALAPGLYLLRVDYASGPVTRRIVIE